MRADRMALVTVASDDFLAGTLVMIESFRRENPAFSGDIVVLYESLQSKSFDILTSCFPDLVTRKLSAPLLERMAEVRRCAGWSGGKHLQFGSLELFALVEFDRIIFCDSDLLFLGSMDSLLALDAALVCCGDGAYFRGNRRRIPDFVEVPPDRSAEFEDAIGNTFNSGLMVLDSRLITLKNHRNLLDMMDPVRWSTDRTGHTDQMLLNQYFAGQQTLAPPIYNYMLSHRDLIESVTGIAPDQAKVLHFTGPLKPWHPLDAVGTRPVDRRYFSAYSKWRAELEALSERLPFDLPRVLDRL